MIVITLVGNSSRFFEAGYKKVKYKLEIKGKTILENILNYIPRDKNILILLNKKYNDFNFAKEILNKLNFKKYYIIELNNTSGQLESLYLGLKEYINNVCEIKESISVFNGDTIRKLKNWDKFDCDGYVEVFESDGTHWSFIDNLNKITLVTEKIRISNYCSSGLYYFRNADLILDNYLQHVETQTNQELFIAPFYNLLISKNMLIKGGLTNKENFTFCGTPSEYENSK